MKDKVKGTGIRRGSVKEKEEIKCPSLYFHAAFWMAFSPRYGKSTQWQFKKNEISDVNQITNESKRGTEEDKCVDPV